MPQSAMLGPGLGGLVLAVASWFIIPVVIVVVIRIGMRPTNERLDRLALVLQQRRDAGA